MHESIKNFVAAPIAQRVHGEAADPSTHLFIGTITWFSVNDRRGWTSDVYLTRRLSHERRWVPVIHLSSSMNHLRWRWPCYESLASWDSAHHVITHIQEHVKANWWSILSL